MIRSYLLENDERTQILISSMAEPIKLMLGNFLLPFFGTKPSKLTSLVNCLYGDAKDEPVEALGQTPRRMLQTLGTEWGRSVHPDVWIKCKKAVIDSYDNEGRNLMDLVLIPDIRFDNEAVQLCDVVVAIDRPYNPDALKTAEATGHASESGVSGCYVDISVSNDATLADLEASVPAIWAGICEKAYRLEQQHLGEDDDELNN
jgi:hypothetical protein